MDNDLSGRLYIVGHGSEVVALLVPDDLLDDVGEGHLDHFAAECVVDEFPLLELLLLLIDQHILLVALLSCVDDICSCLVDLRRVQRWLDNVDVLLIAH